MKKIFFIILSLIFSWRSLVAQEGMLSTGKIPSMKIERSHTFVNQPDNPTGTAHGYSNLQSETLSMPLPGGAPFTWLSQWDTPYGYFASSMSNAPYYGIPRYITVWTDWGGHPQQLYQMDPSTGTISFVGNILGMGSDQPIAIAYYPMENRYYLISFTNLYLFDVCTLVATLIGPFNADGFMIAFCFDISGVCYAYNLTDDNAYTIDISTGNATLLGPLGYDANYGQGMSYDYETNTIYLSAFNGGTMTGQLRTMNASNGSTTLITDWGYEQIAPFAVDCYFVGPCWAYFDPPVDPVPSNGTVDVNVSGTMLTWTNSPGDQNVELYFGPRDSIKKVYDGPAINSWSTGSLQYQTDYFWHVVCKNPCTVHGPVWNFTTEARPGVVFWEDFFNLLCWTWIGPLGQENWTLLNFNNAGGTPPELHCNTRPLYNGLNQQLSCTIYSVAGHNHEFRFKYKYNWGYDPAPAHGLAISYDGGMTSTLLWEQTPIGGNTGPEEIVFQYTPTSSSFQLVIYNSGNCYNFESLFYDDFQITDLDFIPAEIISFTAEVDDNVVTLYWQTATETNNSGFEILRFAQNDNEWKAIGFVLGFGTTTEPKSYCFVDDNVTSETYKYRLKQIDFDGSFEYSNEIEINVDFTPKEFVLYQNYPNPFNPSTKIKYEIPNLGTRDRVSVRIIVYDILGNEVATLVNKEKQPGVYEVEFNIHSDEGQNLSSGIYFYQLRAGNLSTGSGQIFVETKKLILLR